MRKGSVKFWAWTISIAVHVLLLAVFAITKFSLPTAQAETTPAPITRIEQVTKLMQAQPIIPKPKIKWPTESKLTKKTDNKLSANKILQTPPQGSDDFANLADPSATISDFSTAVPVLPAEIEFFGSKTNKRKICYVVDCSGSMRGTFEKVRENLKKSIANLQPDHYFYVIFFGADKLFEFGDGRLTRASKKNKAKAMDFINSVKPTGKTNALTALERSMHIRDAAGDSPSVIYFLTDGFELTLKDKHNFSQKIMNLLKRFAPRTKINTIGFWPQDDDRKILEIIAKQTDGEFIAVTSENN